MSYAPSFRVGPCPVCGKSEGTFMGKSTWSWGGMACSDACGEAASAAIDQVCASESYRKALAKLRGAEEKVARLKIKAVAAIKR